MRFYLGTRSPGWLERSDRPLFLSWHTAQRSRHSAGTCWALDSGGFTQIAKAGAYTTTPPEYAAGVRRLIDEVGRLQFAVVQDFPCSDATFEATRLTVVDHQRLTVDSFITLSELDDRAPWAPVLTGSEPSEYLRHADEYVRRGIDLADRDIVAVGSLVGRPKGHQRAVLEACASLGLRLHGLGVTGAVLRDFAPVLTSADSMAWSMYARREETALCGPDAPHKRCESCFWWAHEWHDRRVRDVASFYQPPLYPGHG